MATSILTILENNLLPLGIGRGVIDKIATEINTSDDAKNLFRCEYFDVETKYVTVEAKDYTDAWVKFKALYPAYEPRTILDIN